MTETLILLQRIDSKLDRMHADLAALLRDLRGPHARQTRPDLTEPLQ